MSAIRTIKVKPRGGVNVRLPDNSGHIDPGGQEIPHSPYIRRRIQDGDLIVVDQIDLPVVVTEEAVPVAETVEEPAAVVEDKPKTKGK